MSSCQHCPRERLIKQLSLDFSDEKGLIMMLLEVGGNDWWTVITVLQSVINKKYFSEWHVYFSGWKIVSEKVCVAVTHCYISILILRRNNLPFLKCDYVPFSKSRFAVWTAGWTKWHNLQKMSGLHFSPAAHDLVSLNSSWRKWSSGGLR